MSKTIADLVAFLKTFAPPALAEEWDNVGLLVGDAAQPAERVLTCLTLTPDVAAEAIARKANLVVTHHPILFRPVKRLTADDAQGKMLLDLIAARVAVYSPHTSYDSAADGINQQLAIELGLTEIVPLRPAAAEANCKIVCFVPQTHLAAVQEALWSAGAGRIGEYDKCSFVLDGTGTFLGSEASNPTVGTAGNFEHVAEARLEVICPKRSLSRAIESLRAAHPYEEPAFDVYPLESTATNSIGTGRMGRLPADTPLSQFNALIQEKFHVPHLQFVGDANRAIRRVAIACGSGAELLKDAISHGCDVLLTGEARFHSALEARAAGIVLVLAGHYATERPAMERLADLLAAQFPGLVATPSQSEADPLQWN